MILYHRQAHVTDEKVLHMLLSPLILANAEELIFPPFLQTKEMVWGSEFDYP